MIVAHNNTKENIFKDLIAKTIKELHDKSKKDPKCYKNRGGVALEKDVHEIITKLAKNTIYNGKIELISGQRFPDIVAYVNKNNAYGLEVKTTKLKSWKSTGSSIFEGTRVENVRNIYLLFGKLSSPIEFKFERYEDCLYSVAITHSPRYLIDMNTDKSDTIFSKIGIPYNDLRKLENPFEPIKKYLRERLNKSEDLWWIDKDDEEDNNKRDFTIKHWSNLTSEEKEEKTILALAYFPTLFGSNQKKFHRLATWLVSQFGIVNHALRDIFSAGGKISIKGTTKKFPQIYKYIRDDLDAILKSIDKIPKEDLCFYWKVDEDEIEAGRVDLWKELCLQNIKSNGRDGLKNIQIKIVEDLLSNSNHKK